jgi:hypothetical protein
MDLKIGGPWLISHQPAVLFSQNELATTTSQQYFSLRRNQHQPSAISQPNRLNSSNIWDVAADVEEQVLFQCATFSFNIINVCRVNPPTFVSSSTILVVGAIVRGRMSPLHRVCERARYDHCRRGQLWDAAPRLPAWRRRSRTAQDGGSCLHWYGRAWHRCS